MKLISFSLSSSSLSSLVIVIVILSINILQVNCIPQQEVNFLKELYLQTNGSHWLWRPNLKQSKWNFTITNPNPCNTNEFTWQGITCSKIPQLCSDITSNCNIIKINLNEYNLNGYLPSNWTNLTYLKVLSLNKNKIIGKLPLYYSNSLSSLSLTSNRFKGQIPSTMKNLYLLEYLSLDRNRLTGTLPLFLGNLYNLTFIELSFNLFSKTIPSNIGNLKKLKVFSTVFTKFTGSIPSSIGYLTSLELIDLSFNSLTNTIPSSIGNLQSLESIILDYNSLNGSLPITITSLSSLSLFSIATNLLTGSITIFNSNLFQLSRISIGYNSFNGNIPLFNGMTKLTMINLDTNFLTGTIPSEIGSLIQLNGFTINNNLVKGKIPTSFQNLIYLTHLDLSSNSLTNTIPSIIGCLTSLVDLALRINYLSGTIPTTISLLSSLEQITMRENLFSSTIPCEIQQLTNLVVLVLDTNYFTEICNELIFTEKLEVIDISDNLIHNSIQSNMIIKLSNLQVFDLYNNLLTGSLPNNLNSFSNIYKLDLSNNYITGKIPSTIGYLTKLNQLNLGSNHLTGKINSWLWQVSKMSLINIDLSANTLEDKIYEEIFLLPFIQTLALTSNCFDGTISNKICYGKELLVLSLDGLGSASGCKDEKKIPFSHVNYNYKKIIGNIPNCIWKEMKNLTALSLSGNGLTGTIGEIDLTTTSLINLTLSHNHLSGTIPQSIQKHFFQSLDLSYNKLTGEYNTINFFNFSTNNNFIKDNINNINAINSINFNLKSIQRRLILEVNRLSGKFTSINSHNNNNNNNNNNNLYLNVLTGNIFSCKHLPSNDVNVNTYHCGSKVIDETMITFTVIFGICIIILLFITYLIKYFHKLQKLIIIQKITNWIYSITSNLYTYLTFENYFKDIPELKFLSFSLQIFKHLQYFLFKMTIVCIILPFSLYILRFSNKKYSTHTHLYRWEWTTAYLSGELPAGLLLSCWFIVICILLLEINYLKTKYIDIKLLQNKDSHINVNIKTEINLTKKESDCLIDSNNKNNNDCNCNCNCNYNYNAYISYIIQKYFSSIRINIIFNNIFLLTINIGVMGTINALYILSTDLEISSKQLLIIQLSMALFKVIWNKFCIPILDFSQKSHKLRIFLLILNSIFIPCIATALTSPSCFQELLYKPEDIYSFYYFKSCGIYRVTDGVYDCVMNQFIRVDVPAFTPSFTYNYLCGSTLLSTYLPVYFYIYLIQIIFIPFTSYFIQRFVPYSTLSSNIKVNFPGVLWPEYWIQYNFNQSKKIFFPRLLYNGDSFANKFMQDIVVLITFGLCSPVLCLVIGLSIFLSLLESHIMIGYFIYTKITSLKKDTLSFSSNISLNSKNVDIFNIKELTNDITNDISLQNIQNILHQMNKLCCNLVWMVIWSSCFFFIFLCWDIAGDEVGLENSIWVPISSFGICLFGYFINLYYNLKNKIINKDDELVPEFTLSLFHNPTLDDQEII